MKHFLFIAFLFCLNLSFAQSVHTYKELRSGIFYQYPRQPRRQMKIYQNEGFEKDVDLKTGDTTLFENTWLSDSLLSQKCISSNEKVMVQNWRYVRKHTFVTEITKITERYFLVNMYIDKVSRKPFERDTVWFQPRTSSVNDSIIKRTTTKEIKNNLSVKDTAKYALLYIYRPFKIKLALATYDDYFNGDAICTMKNNSGYIYKVFKEGLHKFQSKLYADEASIDVDVHFGNTYYIKSSINWGITSKLYNFKLEMQQMDNATGVTEFGKVRER